MINRITIKYLYKHTHRPKDGFIDGKDATQENIMALATQFETAPDAAAANQ